MSKRTNLFVALGLAGAAYYLFNMKPESKEKLKGQLNKIKDDALSKIPKDIKEKINSSIKGTPAEDLK